MAYEGRPKHLNNNSNTTATPFELRIGTESVDVWLDDRGIHFRQGLGHCAEGMLPWDLAIAMSLVPESLRPISGRLIH